MEPVDFEKLEVDLVLDAIYRGYGYDFRNYARSSLMRRLHYVRQKAGLAHLSEMIPKILHEEAFVEKMVLDMSVTVTEMFRDPEFFLELRSRVVPILRTYPYVNIWHAGCATGEEVYSMAILLQEEGFYDRVRIYATDMNGASLQIAEEGIYSHENIRTFTANYNRSGGKRSFSDYYYAKYDVAKMNEDLKRNIVFSNHNLVTDRAFGEMHLIVCRNVLIYFDRELQNRVFQLFDQSLVQRGVLCLGSKESLEFSGLRGAYEDISPRWRIFRKQLRI